MGASFGVEGVALEAGGEDLVFLVVEAAGPEKVVGEVEFERAPGGVGGVLGDLDGLPAEFTVPGGGHSMEARGAVVEAGVLGRTRLTFGRTGPGGFLGVGAIGGDLPVRDAGEGHGV